VKLKKQKDKSAGYLKVVEWSDEDGCFIGSAPPLIGNCCHGADEARVYAELVQIVKEWVAIHGEDGRALPEETAGKEYSGKFVIRIDSGLHKAAALRALQAGESLNSFVAAQLARSVRS
jgi:predicted HicB family RNase H-like nuclease